MHAPTLVLGGLLGAFAMVPAQAGTPLRARLGYSGLRRL
jgi:hypothetical protein